MPPILPHILFSENFSFRFPLTRLIFQLFFSNFFFIIVLNSSKHDSQCTPLLVTSTKLFNNFQELCLYKNFTKQKITPLCAGFKGTSRGITDTTKTIKKHFLKASNIHKYFHFSHFNSPDASKYRSKPKYSNVYNNMKYRTVKNFYEKLKSFACNSYVDITKTILKVTPKSGPRLFNYKPLSFRRLKKNTRRYEKSKRLFWFLKKFAKKLNLFMKNRVGELNNIDAFTKSKLQHAVTSTGPINQHGKQLEINQEHTYRILQQNNITQQTLQQHQKHKFTLQNPYQQQTRKHNQHQPIQQHIHEPQNEHQKRHKWQLHPHRRRSINNQSNKNHNQRNTKQLNKKRKSSKPKKISKPHTEPPLMIMLNYSLEEECSLGTFVANIRKDAKMENFYNSKTASSLKYSFLKKRSQQRETNLFSLHAVTSVLKTAKRIDREELCEANSPLCVVTIDLAIQPVQYFRIVRVSITIGDVNDHKPVFIDSVLEFNVLETATPGSTSLVIPPAYDPDGPLFAIQVGVLNLISIWVLPCLVRVVGSIYTKVPYLNQDCFSLLSGFFIIQIYWEVFVILFCGCFILYDCFMDAPVILLM